MIDQAIIEFDGPADRQRSRRGDAGRSARWRKCPDAERRQPSAWNHAAKSARGESTREVHHVATRPAILGARPAPGRAGGDRAPGVDRAPHRRSSVVARALLNPAVVWRRARPSAGGGALFWRGAGTSASWPRPSARPSSTSRAISTLPPAADRRSRAIVEQMKVDEAEHAATALRLGAHELPAPAKGDEASPRGDDDARLPALERFPCPRPRREGSLGAAAVLSPPRPASTSWIISAVLPSMIEAEQYFSADR